MARHNPAIRMYHRTCMYARICICLCRPTLEHTTVAHWMVSSKLWNNCKNTCDTSSQSNVWTNHIKIATCCTGRWEIFCCTYHSLISLCNQFYPRKMAICICNFPKSPSCWRKVPWKKNVLGYKALFTLTFIHIRASHFVFHYTIMVPYVLPSFTYFHAIMIFWLLSCH